MTEYKFIENLHEELHEVHDGLSQYDGVDLENGYKTGPFIPEHGSIEGYEELFADKDRFEENGGLLRFASSVEEAVEMIQKPFEAEYVTMGKIPIRGPLGESLVQNVDLNYNMKVEDDEVYSYWELDSRRVDIDKKNARKQIRNIESIVDEYSSVYVEQLPVESESEGLKGIASRAD